MRDLKIFTNNIEIEALDQINTLLDQEVFENSKVRIMPDVHAGKGCVIGFTANLGDKVIPNIVGVDIGCGMLTAELGNIDLDLEKLDEVINKYIPSGRNIHGNKQITFDRIKDMHCYKYFKNKDRFEKSIGTLGGGNHFIEVDVDELNNKYLIIHSGSRNLGNQVAKYYQDLAIKLCDHNGEMLLEKENKIKRLKRYGKEELIQFELKLIEDKYQKINPNLPDDLCYLKGKYRNMYLNDMKICQEYASLNRRIILSLIRLNYNEIVNNNFINIENSFETIHNYIDLESNIVRKGSISAKLRERVLIPINMRDGCIIAIGKGNDDYNQSAPHGAGRLMSRTKAKETYNLDEYKESMKGIYTTSINKNTIDEAPFVYKPIQEILDNIKDTAEVERIIKPIYSFKASE